MFRILLAFLLLSSWLPTRAAPLGPAGPAPITIAAAADLKYVLDSLITIFNRQHPASPVTVVYGSSGKFFEQLSHGAPFDIFFSADGDYPYASSSRALRRGHRSSMRRAAWCCGARS
ncbi:substrate-binding domain-containing protein [Hymenobacter sp. BRD67]|nr:substrate-binding domain-containing protein [Hymenobacter sp. BRD67]QKG53678.1 substrate-binding domain-containing protein [Hymenobacter sp. BRD67]